MLRKGLQTISIKPQSLKPDRAEEETVIYPGEFGYTCMNLFLLPSSLHLPSVTHYTSLLHFEQFWQGSQSWGLNWGFESPVCDKSRSEMWATAWEGWLRGASEKPGSGNEGSRKPTTTHLDFGAFIKYCSSFPFKNSTIQSSFVSLGQIISSAQPTTHTCVWICAHVCLLMSVCVWLCMTVVVYASGCLCV